jgi:hypothetical protein
MLVHLLLAPMSSLLAVAVVVVPHKEAEAVQEAFYSCQIRAFLQGRTTLLLERVEEAVVKMIHRV